MAKVGSRHFAYTPQGMKQAFSYSKRTGIKQEGGYASKTITKDKKGKTVPIKKLKKISQRSHTRKYMEGRPALVDKVRNTCNRNENISTKQK